METVIHHSVGHGNELQGGDVSKRRQLPIGTSNDTYEFTPDDSDRDGAELGHNDDITS